MREHKPPRGTEHSSVGSPCSGAPGHACNVCCGLMLFVSVTGWGGGDRPTELALVEPWSRSELTSSGRFPWRCTLGHICHECHTLWLGCTGKDGAGRDSALLMAPPSKWFPATDYGKGGGGASRKGRGLQKGVGLPERGGASKKI